MDGYVTIETELDTKSFDAQIDYVKSQLEDIEDKLKQADMGFEVGDTQKLEAQYEKLTDKLKNLIKKKQEFNQTPTVDLSGVTNSIEGIGKSIKKTTKKITKMALAVFGIRSAFMFVRRAISTITADDEQLKADIDYMKNALAYTLEPVVRGIVNLAKQLMFYVAYIVKAWTGVNIFANANKNLDKANKKAKELKKTTAGFDEMEVLSDNGSSESSATPSFDLTKPEDYPVPGWIKWIADNGDTVKGILLGIAGALVALKLGFGPLKALGIGIALAGIYKMIKSILNFIKDPSFKNFMGILEGIALTVLGIGIAFGAWPVAIAAALALAVVEIVKWFDEISEFFDGIISWFDTDFLGALRALFGPLGDMIYLPFEIAIKAIKVIFDDLFGGIKTIIDGIVQMFNGDFLGGLGKVFEGLFTIMKMPFDLLIKVIETWINRVVQFFQGLWNSIKGVMQSIWNTITGIFGAMADWIYSHTIKPIADMFGGLADKIGGFFDGIGKGVGKVGSFFGKVGKGIGDFFGFQKGGIIVPRLASGGIINQPGRGVPLASAIGGEHGAEGVIPLTDSQQMELLGASIGKYITINLTNVNEMNGRVLSREIKRVQSESDFAYNR